MYAPHTVTIYNLSENQVTFEKEYNITVLHGVLLDAVQAANINKSGLENADSIMLYIPFNVSAGGKTYLTEKEYEQLSDKSLNWTMRPNKDFFVKGEVVIENADYQSLNTRFDNVYRITTVDTKDFGTADMQHWEVGGR